MLISLKAAEISYFSVLFRGFEPYMLPEQLFF